MSSTHTPDPIDGGKTLDPRSSDQRSAKIVRSLPADELGDRSMSLGLTYWKAQLAGIPLQLALPTDRPRPVRPTCAAEACTVRLPAAQVERLKLLSEANEATLYMTLLLGLAAVLARYSGQEDIVIGSPIANRRDTQVQGLIDFFVNTLAIRVRVQSDQSFSDLIEEVRATMLEAHLHQDVPIERLVEELSPESHTNSRPLFQVTFELQTPLASLHEPPELEILPVPINRGRVHNDLELQAVEHKGGLEFSWVYQRELFDRWRIEQLASHYVQLLEEALAQPGVPLRRLEILSARERRVLLENFNATARPLPETTLPELFEAQAGRTPEAIALVFEKESLTYGELNERANRLAHHLIGFGVGPENLVGVALERSLDMVVALLGVLKAGAAYLPLDPSYPDARLAYMLANAAPALVLTNGVLRQRLSLYIESLDLSAPVNQAALGRAPAHNP